MMKTEYPRPQLVRKDWQNLNGEWKFAFDDQDIGVKEMWFKKEEKYDLNIMVPFVYQCELSGISNRDHHDIVWYYREFTVEGFDGKSVILHFGAVDYEADVYINGQHVCHHIGGHTSFEVDICNFLIEGLNQTISLRVFDPHKDESIPRGKQFWEDQSRAIWYTNSTGIWQSVWLETVEKQHIESIRYTPIFDEGKIEIEVALSQWKEDVGLSYEILFKEEKVAKGCLEFINEKLVFTVDLFQEHIFRSNYHNNGWSWTPEQPNLFDVKMVLKDKTMDLDTISSYFGMRKVHTENGMVYLNNKPYYQKLVLDQGYWPKGLLTAPTDEDFVKDIQLTKEMGFNGCRKHQKMEDPRFMYWADKLGFLVWGECAAPPIYNNDSVERLMIEWSDIVHRDYNHPSIITWVPINESWGVPNISFDRKQQHFSQTMYHYLHALDTTRLVISNDGWAATETDIVAIHNYAHGQSFEEKKYEYFVDSLSTREKLIMRISTPWPIFANGFTYENQPILLTEFGGIGFDVSGQEGWGYTSALDEEEFVKEYARIMEGVYASKGLWGFCYTQITDVEQEINGLLTYERKAKCDLKKIKEINDGYRVYMVE
ncbi:glycoside hydrolase family 2 [Lachnospiraceae bacterium OttesenSCG-928-D06]|nr:glycoside hydrolase family 2 [Lachnospiraceae bacterium OttesenSCG-928-D06]